ncbi:class III extradiol ring-cleavage dioxygenase [Veillonella caviae]|uniref:dioxygenase family protein n=1 Tax=Veillonella caviae TaxID=248316 RepID=UPI002A91975C|nr:class III extradiol ring-cleavage dioxygenase [Veillonella caviae]MDY5787063.1 class III extradiol ring-cleavage dioxygenase [Veillonella caviae]
MKRMPVIFAGHGSPMLAIEDSEQTRGLQQIGKEILQNYGKPKAILAISAHWYTKGTFIQSTPEPKQIYDMYGFPDELYKITYPVKGYMPLTKAVQSRLGNTVSIDDSWGIDHGIWTILIHMFPNADIPVVQLSVNGYLNAKESYELGKQLITLRDEGYLIIGSGNIVHNLGELEWNNVGGSTESIEFNTAITNAVTSGDIKL